MNDRQCFIDTYNVPRGTALLFDRYSALLIDWQSRMNLVAPSTVDQLWQRHFADSAQLIGLVPAKSMQWLDIGSGAGFPGLVVALLSEHRVTLIESIGKKCRFLREIIDQLGLSNAVVRNERAESLGRGDFDIISARACSPLVRLFELGYNHAHKKTCWLLLKGETVEHELEDARLSFDFEARLVPSRTDSRGRIVVATEVRRRTKRQ